MQQLVDSQEVVQLRDELGCVDNMVLVLILEDIRTLCRLRDELVCVLDDIVVVLQVLEANQELDQLRDDADELVLDDADELVLLILEANQKVRIEVLEDRVLVVGEGFGVRLVQQAKIVSVSVSSCQLATHDASSNTSPCCLWR